MHYEGKGGLVQSNFQAFKWIETAAAQSFAEAQNNLGWMYQKGLGVDQSDQEAVKWYQKAADQGFAPAQSNLNRIAQKLTSSKKKEN